MRKPIKVAGFILGALFLLHITINAFEVVFWWKSPFFSSVDVSGITQKAIATKDPSKCSALAENLGDGNPQAGCYWYSVIAVKNPVLCDKYPVNAQLCHNAIGSSYDRSALCASETETDRFNACIYSATSWAGPSVCDLVKIGSDYSKDRCLIGIIEGNPQTPTNDANRICNMISDVQIHDACVVALIERSHNGNLCATIIDPKLIDKGSIAADVCLKVPSR